MAAFEAELLVALEPGSGQDGGRLLHHGGLFVVVHLVDLAGEEHSVERRVLLDCQRVDAHVLDAQAHGLFHARAELGGRLPWQAAHKVHAHVLEPLLRGSDGAACAVGVERAQQAVVEALHADGQTVHAERPEVARKARIKALRVRLHADLDLVGEVHGDAEHVEQAGQAP